MNLNHFIDGSTPLKVEGIIKSVLTILLFVGIVMGIFRVLGSFSIVTISDDEKISKLIELNQWYNEERFEISRKYASTLFADYNGPLTEEEWEEEKLKLDSVHAQRLDDINNIQPKKHLKIDWGNIFSAFIWILSTIFGFCILQMLCNISIKLD